MSKYLDLDSLKEYNGQMKQNYIDPLDRRVTDLENAKVSTDGTSIINDEGVLRLNDKYADYLAEMTFQKPQIATFELDVDKTLFEIGETISIEGFSHKETNIDNIKQGIVQLQYSNGSELVSDDFVASNLKADVAFNTAHTITPQNTNAIKYTLKGVDTRNNTFKKECLINVCIPYFLGYVSVDELTNPVTELTKKLSTSLNGTHTVSVTSNNGGYIYLVTTSSINKIVDNASGFDAEWSRIGTMDVVLENNIKITKTYNVYRTIKLNKGTYSLKVS